MPLFLEYKVKQMSLLIQLRYRIKAIETIKKITHAMRLISMSSRSRLKNKEEPLQEYMQTSASLLAQLKKNAPHWRNPIINPSPNATPNPLLILIGSQRGLCGNFNTTLFHFFEKDILTAFNNNKKIQIIPIGKKAVNYVNSNPTYAVIAEYPELNASSLSTIASDVIAKIVTHTPPFTHVSVYHNQLKTFFIQKPQHITLIPFEAHTKSNMQATIDYYWEQSPAEIIEQLAYQTLEVQLHYFLFQSLLAEHAARFISMDSATRNAQNLLEETQLQYNKLRQAKITKELTELVSSM
jgi:F-type H+-transporting ATPase subunit gamma